MNRDAGQSVAHECRVVSLLRDISKGFVKRSDLYIHCLFNLLCTHSSATICKYFSVILQKWDAALVEEHIIVLNGCGIWKNRAETPPGYFFGSK